MQWVAAALAILLLSGFTGFWAPSSFEECRDKAARDAKTEAGLGVLIRSCRKQFPKLSELKNDWARFARAIKSHKYNPATPRRSTEPVARTEAAYGGFFADKYGGEHMTTEGRANLLITKEFMNWFVSQPKHVKSLLVSPMLHANEDKIFEAYGRF